MNFLSIVPAAFHNGAITLHRAQCDSKHIYLCVLNEFFAIFGEIQELHHFHHLLVFTVELKAISSGIFNQKFFLPFDSIFFLSYIRFSAVELAIKVSENRFSFYVNVWIIIHGIFTSMRGESAWILRIANSTELQLLYYFRILLIQCIYRITCPCGKKERVANEHICIDIKLWWL